MAKKNSGRSADSQETRPENTAEGQQALRRDLVAKARDIVPLLRKNTAHAEEIRRLPEENLAALDGAGLFGLRAPNRYGGLEADLRTYMDVVAEIGRGCGSTAWIAFISNATAWIAALFSDEAQDDFFAGHPDVRFIGLLAPTSEAMIVDGGYAVTGAWAFASGCHHADWALLAVPLPQEGGSIVPGLVAAPVSDLTIEDTWQVVGMAATGSDTVHADKVFVPSHRTMPLGCLLGDTPLRSQRDEAVYREAIMPGAILMVAAPVLGMARAAMDLTLERIGKGTKRISYSSYEDLRESPSMQMQIAEAATLIETGHAIVQRWSDDIAEAARRGDEFPVIERARMRMDLGHAVKSCRDGVDRLLNVQGASAFAKSNPIQQVWRDIECSTRHGLLSIEMPHEIYGRLLAGQDQTISPFL